MSVNYTAKLGDPLTPRERDLMDLILSGATNLEIAKAWDRSPKTVETHLNNVKVKTGISRRVLLALWYRDTLAVWYRDTLAREGG